MGKKFPNVKRYGLEGAESMMVALDRLFEISAKGTLVVIWYAIFFFPCALTSNFSRPKKCCRRNASPRKVKPSDRPP
jgi:hypothetical protein